jgi:hypothetical protein
MERLRMKPKHILDKGELPSQSRVETKLFALLKLTLRPKEADFFYEQLAQDFGLSSVETKAKMENGELAWPNRVRQAKRALVTAGVVHDAAASGHNNWVLTPKGRKTEKWPDRTTLADLGLDD